MGKPPPARGGSWPKPRSPAPSVTCCRNHVTFCLTSARINHCAQRRGALFYRVPRPVWSDFRTRLLPGEADAVKLPLDGDHPESEDEEEGREAQAKER